MTITNPSGSLGPRPVKLYSLGALRVSLVIAPFVYAGYFLGGEFAELIERLELYVPDDEEDDD